MLSTYLMSDLLRPRFLQLFQAPKAKKETQAAPSLALGPQAREGELVFGVCHIFASFNDTFVHVTDLSGRETIVRVTGKKSRFFCWVDCYFKAV